MRDCGFDELRTCNDAERKTAASRQKKIVPERKADPPDNGVIITCREMKRGRGHDARHYRLYSRMKGIGNADFPCREEKVDPTASEASIGEVLANDKFNLAKGRVNPGRPRGALSEKESTFASTGRGELA